MKHATSIYDVVRIDHFRGFESYYSIPAGNTTAAGGKWVKGPDRAFIDAMHEALGQGGIIAEDLGYLTPEVKTMLAASGYPGMKIMQFAFDSREPGNYLPYTYTRNSVVYTGTHDNVTTGGCPLRLPVSALHPQRPDRSHDRGLPFLRVGHGHHPDGGLAPPRCRSPHQHPQHPGLQLAVASDHAPDEPAGGPHRRSDGPV